MTGFGVSLLILLADAREAVRKALVVFVGGVLEKTMPSCILVIVEPRHGSSERGNCVRRRLGGLEECLLADLALDAHGFLVLEDGAG